MSSRLKTDYNEDDRVAELARIIDVIYGLSVDLNSLRLAYEPYDPFLIFAEGYLDMSLGSMRAKLQKERAK